MENPVCRLRNQARTLFLEEGAQKIPSVTPYQFTTERIPMPQTEHPYLYIVLDGILRMHTPSGMMDYMAVQYSVSKIDAPLSGTVLAFSSQRDFLAVCVEFPPSEAIQTNDPRITLVAGGYPLFVKGRIAGGIGGGTEAQDCETAEYVVSMFERLTA